MPHRSNYLRPDGEIDWSHPDVPEHLFEAEPVPLEDLGVTPSPLLEYAAVPQEAWAGLPSAMRLFLALHFAYRTWKPSEPGGWYRLGHGLQARAGLEDREKRRVAVNNLHRSGLIDVRRAATATTLVRLRSPGPKKVTSRRTK